MEWFNQLSAADAAWNSGKYEFTLNSDNLKKRSDGSILMLFKDLSFDDDLRIRVDSAAGGMFRYSYSDAHGKGSSGELMNKDILIEGNGIKLDWLLIDPGVTGKIKIILE